MLRTISGLFLLILTLLWIHHWHWIGQFLYEGAGDCDDVVGRDFFMFWTMGRAALHANPGQYYHIETFLPMMHGLLGPAYCVQQWSYPPPVFFPAVPFGLLPYIWALLAWSVLGPLLLMGFAWRDRAIDAALVLLSPAAFICLVSGQNSFFTLALLYGGFILRKQRPTLAGVLFGLLIVKPQLAVLTPVLLLAERNWRAIGIAALTALGAIATTWFVFGWEVWTQFVQFAMPENAQILQEPARNIMAYMPTVFMDLRAAGSDYKGAMAIQILLTLGMAIATYRYFRKPQEAVWGFLFFATASFLASPYGLAYDLLPVTLGLSLVLTTRGLNATHRALFSAMYWLPVLHYVAISFHLPGMALLPAFLLSVAWKKGKEAKPLSARR